MLDVLKRVGAHTLEFLVIVGASALVVSYAPRLGVDLSPQVLALISGGVLAALVKLVRELGVDYVNRLGRSSK